MRSFRYLLPLLCGLSAHAQPWSSFLDSSRAIDWTQAGIPGGIPARSTICSTVNASSYGNGSSDATSGIQSALNACGSGQAVMLSAGKFRINGSIRIPSNVTLRGAGAQQTILDARGSGSGVVTMGLSDTSTPIASNSTTVTGGTSAGSKSITVSSASGISVGSYLLITELNDPNYVTISTPNGTCSWCDNSMWSGNRVRGQIVEVTSVSGSTVGISPGLYSAYGAVSGTSPVLATRFSAAAKYAGVEYLQIYANNTGYVSSIFMNQCAYCWVKGVENNYADADHVDLYFSYRAEVRDSYFSNAYLHTSGSSDSCIFIVGKTSGSLIENNILERLHSSVILNWGAAGNVISYNYSMGSFDSAATNAVMIDFDVHGAHPQFNLWEGNVTPRLYPDSFWGSGSHNTAYRNWFTGTTKVAPPYSGRGPVDWANAHFANQQNRGVSVAFPQTRYNFVGNVSGSADVAKAVSSEYRGGPAACPACLVAPGTRNYGGTFYAYDFGFDTGSDGSGGGVPSKWVGVAYSTAFLHGNFDTVTDATYWNSSNSTRTLPASLYRSSKPSWFGSAPWPAIGPDVTGGIDASGHVAAIPALACYNNTAKDSNGLLKFDAATCYGSGAPGGNPPAAPTGLTVTVR